MHESYYDIIQPYYGQDNINVLDMNTDLLCFQLYI